MLKGFSDLVNTVRYNAFALWAGRTVCHDPLLLQRKTEAPSAAHGQPSDDDDDDEGQGGHHMENALADGPRRGKRQVESALLL